jgi:hypothetical protein
MSRFAQISLFDFKNILNNILTAKLALLQIPCNGNQVNKLAIK